MSYVTTKGRFHAALNGVGIILQGAPDRLGYQQGQAPVYGQRFASGDRDYNDLSQWWYFVQTDWAGGFKDTVAWANDAKYYYATNIDAWSESGAIKLSRKQALDETFTENLVCGAVAEVNGETLQWVGTDDNADTRPRVYSAPLGEAQTWTDKSTTAIDANQNAVSQLSGRLGILWISTVGSGATDVVMTFDGTTWTDQSAYIYNAGATITFQPLSSRCHVENAGIQYVFVDDSANNKYALVKTSTVNPSAAANWSAVFEKTLTDGLPVACAAYNGKIHYIVNFSTHCEYWQWDLTASTNTLIRKFNNVSIASQGVGDKLFVELNGKLIITIPTNQIWELDGTTLTRLYIRDEFKRVTLTSFSSEAGVYLANGAIVADNKLWWGNLMYDGTYFYNTFKDYLDVATVSIVMLYADTSNRLWHTDSSNNKKIYDLNPAGTSSYKGSDDENYLVLNNFDTVSGVEKLAYSLTLLFKPLASGQSIEIEYMLGELTNTQSWTSLGTASATADGTTVRSKTLFFTTGIIFNKIWLRVKLESGGTDTPTLNDVVMEYLPYPTYKKLWTLNVDAGESVKALDGRLNETTGRELKSLIETAWWTKSTLDFQDVDYATTLLDGALTASATTITVDNTYDFPEQGRLRLEDEELFYTGKTPTTFTGVTRGVRGSRAVAHSDNTVINNAYKVIITDLNVRVPIILKDKQLEYTVGVSLREV